MRSEQGIQLLEMVVAVALSGVFVVLLSGMLGQTFSFSTASQNQILAASAADLLAESAMSRTYQQISAMPVHADCIINAFQADQNPIQLDLSRSDLVFGTAKKGQIDFDNKWDASKGNYFNGTATQDIVFTTVDELPCAQVVIKITYPSETGGSKTTTRTAWVFKDGAQIH